MSKADAKGVRNSHANVNQKKRTDGSNTPTRQALENAFAIRSRTFPPCVAFKSPCAGTLLKS